MADFAGFIGGDYEATSIWQDAQESINWYVEIDQNVEAVKKGFKVLYPTPGTYLLFSLPYAGEVRAIYPLPGGSQVLIVCGPFVYLVDQSYTVTQIGVLQSSSGSVSITDNRISAYIVDGGNRYTYVLNGVTAGVFAQIANTDGAFQGGDICCFIDDFIIYNQPSGNQWAATSALSTVTPGISFGSMLSSPDNIIGLIVDHRQVYLFGEYTTEVWVNVGAYPFPFQVVPGSTMQVGCAARRSIARLGGSIAWLGKNERGEAIVYMAEGYTEKRISTHAIENDISEGRIDDAVAFTYQQAGHEFYMLTFPSQDKTWCYDTSSGFWHKRASIDGFGRLHRHIANCHCAFNGLNLVGDAASGNVYALDRFTYTDNGNQIYRRRRAPHIIADLNRVFYDQIQFQFQSGVGLQTGQGFDPKSMLRWSDDAGETWSNSYMLPIGKVGHYKNRCMKRKMGWSRDRVYEISMTDPVNATLISVEIYTQTGDH